MIVTMRMFMIRKVSRKLSDLTHHKKTTEKTKQYYSNIVKNLPAHTMRELRRLYEIWCM